MFDIFSPLVDLFNFLGQVFSAFYEGFIGIINIVKSFFNLLFSFIGILPNPLYSCFLYFMTLYLAIFTYKIIRKG